MSDGFVKLTSRDGRAFDAWRAEPATSNGAGIVILPEVYNVNAWARGIAARYSARGYLVLVPDLFWRQESGVHLDYDQPERARSQGEAADVDAIVSDVGQVAQFLRDRLGHSARIGVVGFCIGGRLALLAAIREKIDAVSAYYPVKLDQHLAELPSLNIPSLIHFGATDPWVPAQTVAAVQRLYVGAPHVWLHGYSDTGHGFARNGFPPYVPEAAERAEQRSLRLFEESLLSGKV